MVESPFREAASHPDIRAMIDNMMATFDESSRNVFEQLQMMQSQIDERISLQNQPPINRLEFSVILLSTSLSMAEA